MKALLKEIFSGEDGRLSSKRVFGALALFFAFALTVYVSICNKDTGVLMFPYTTAGGLFGIGVFEKRRGAS